MNRNKQGDSRLRSKCVLFVLLVIIGLAALLLDEKDIDNSSEVRTRKKQSSNWASSMLKKERTSIDKLITIVQQQKEAVIAELKGCYGDEYYRKLFEQSPGVRINSTLVGATGLSIQRFRRRLQIKILQRFTATRASSSTFVWATAGHSASAGHGNFHNESYTKFMENIAKPAFDAIDIRFTGRNYAMGAMQSAPQLALCNEAVYGADADVLSWDFGMTDGKNFQLKAFMAHRAAVHRNRPVIVDINVFGVMWPEHIEELKIAESKGLATLHIGTNVSKIIHHGLPDMFGMTQAEMDAIPEFSRYIKCNDRLEKGDPFCGARKYQPMCPKRMHKASWHPGWRIHAFYGHTIGLFLIDSLLDAMEALRSNSANGTDFEETLMQLEKEHDSDHNAFLASAVPDNFWTDKKGIFNNRNITEAINVTTFFRNRAYCHTALLPAESRYKGYLTNDDMKVYKRTANVNDSYIYPQGTPKEIREYGPANGTIRRFDSRNYPTGTPDHLLNNEPANGVLRLAYEEKDLQAWCPIEAKIDHKDYFYASNKDGLVSLTFPTDAWEGAYGPLVNPAGYIIACFVPKGCWGRCPLGNLHLDHVNDGAVEMYINELRVTRLSVIAGDCGVAEHASGWSFASNAQGRYSVGLHVHNLSRPLEFIKLTSIIAV